ncbi:hypothetical protein PAXRUDRAFT_26108 [Paxillus rubicundulus Ve08.2h10]|uniref:Uncharacterized protein n=1 Tax=Paxillus rubicundulus Ve08.2h10 TaxID=930991 RepID=A0A0D0E1A6_9AGAM|nr:hypothetical protein PAXRUDRAFT_26108 [Paxillus rubicundulus Ve08.2h10]
MRLLVAWNGKEGPGICLRDILRYYTGDKILLPSDLLSAFKLSSGRLGQVAVVWETNTRGCPPRARCDTLSSPPLTLMVLKGHSVLSFSFRPRFGFGSSQKADSSTRSSNAEKSQEDWYIPYNGPYEMPKDIASTGHHHSGEHDNDPFRSTPLLQGKLGHASPSIHSAAVGVSPVPGDPSRARANTFSGPVQPQTLLIPNIDGGIGESPIPLQRFPGSPMRSRRASRMNFFAFSSGRKWSHGVPIIQFPQSQQQSTPDISMPGGWPSEKVIKPRALVADPTSIPPELRNHEEDYYYSYYSTLTPTSPLSRSATPRIDSTNTPSKQLCSQHQDHFDPNSQHSSPVDNSHTRLQHPYAYPSPLQEQEPLETNFAQPLQHTDSLQPQHRLQSSRTDVNPTLTANIMLTSGASSQLEWETSEAQLRPQPQLRTSTSAPNLAFTAKSSLQPPSKKNAVPATKRKERWLAVETWCDALIFPRPRFKIKQAPGQYSGASQRIASTPVQGESNRIVRVGSPGRPRSVSATLNTGRARPTLTKSRSAADLGKPFTSGLSRSGFEPALETLIDEPTPRESVVDQVPFVEAELSLLDPPPSLTQVMEEGESLQRQRDQWKLQASKSLGNKHTRSLSRVRSGSVSEKYIRGRRKSEGGKGQSHLEFLAARTLLGNQSVMPMVHVSQPSGSSSSHSKSYSHSYSQSSHSHTYSQTSHSHSYSLTTSNSSNSSRNPYRRGHSRNGSWGKTALRKASALCGVGQNDSYSTPEDDIPPLFSRADEPSGISLGNPATGEGALDDVHFDRVISPVPSVPVGEVGVAISSAPPERNALPDLSMEDLSMPGHPFSGDPSYPRPYRVDQETKGGHATQGHTHKSSEYAGPHRSAFGPNLPPPSATSDVSMRHRLPPRAIVHLGAATHPYGSALALKGEPGSSGRGGQGAVLHVPGAGAPESSVGHDLHPHLSLTNADFERYGVGEALVYASFPRPADITRSKSGDLRQPSPPEVESPHRMDRAKTKERSPPRDMVVQPIEETSSGSCESSNDPASIPPTTHVAMPVFDSSDDLDEFQDLFYQPPPSLSRDEHRESSIISKRITRNLHSSESGSALTNLVRSLGEEMDELRALTRTPSDPTRHNTFKGPANRLSSGSELNYVSSDLTRFHSSSPVPMESPSQVPFPTQQEGEPAAHLSLAISEDVVSSAASSVFESPSENDTFGKMPYYIGWGVVDMVRLGYPIRHGLVEAVAPFPIHTPRRASTHLSIMDGIEGQGDVLSPVTAHSHPTPSSAKAVRSSTLTMVSDNSRMSDLSDFPLPPSAGSSVPVLSHFEATHPSSDSHHSDTDILTLGWPLPDHYSHIMSYESRRTTFTASNDIDVIPQIHRSTS